MAIELTAEQRAAVQDRGGDLLVAAAAGSGKTRVLVERLMAAVEAGEDIDRFLVITFTNAAAAELRGRVAAAIQARQAAQPGDLHLRRNASLIYKAPICTIDAFCLDFLRQYGHQAGLDPDFRICDEAEASELRQRALEEVLEERYAHIAEDLNFAALADTMAGERDDQTLESVILDVFNKVQSQPDPLTWLTERSEDFQLPAGTTPEGTPWGQLLLDDVRATAQYWLGLLERALHLASQNATLQANYENTLTQAMYLFQDILQAPDWDSLVNRLQKASLPALGRKRKDIDEILKLQVSGIWDLCKDVIQKKLPPRFSVLGEDAVADLRTVSPSMASLLDMAGRFSAAFSAAKQRRHLIDFSDAEHLTAHLLSNPDGSPTTLALELGAEYAEIMVDEYQDTNGVQNAIFGALAKASRLFMVGDVKQSIYRFRLADPTLFLAKYHAYPLGPDAMPGEARKLLLSANFRSRPEVLEATNFIFKAIMTAEAGELDYTDAEALRCGRSDLTPDPRYATELNVVDMAPSEGEKKGKAKTTASDQPAPSDGEDETASSQEEVPKDLIMARAAAQRIRDLLDSKLPIGDKPIQPEDIVILLRSPGPVMRSYTQALDEEGIPWNAEGGREFFGSTEIAVAISLLSILDNPHQDVPILSVLRSPLFGFPPDRLAELRAGAKGSVYDSIREAAKAQPSGDCGRFLNRLTKLRELAIEESSHRLIWHLYGELDIPALYGAMPDGPLRRANLMALYDEAVRFESAGHKGLMSFLIHLSRMAENDIPVPVPGGNTGGVRILSIHRSKGLEFPVVLLCNLDRNFNLQDTRGTVLFHPSLGLGPKCIDRSRMLRYTTIARDAVTLQLQREMRAEEMRLLYVAMTRAEHKLILFSAVNGRAPSLESLALLAEYPPAPRQMAEAGSMADWILTPALCRTDSGALWGDIPLPHPDPPAEEGLFWDIRKQTKDEVLRRTPPAAPSEGGIPEGHIPIPPNLREMLTWRYNYEGAAYLPSALTVTELKGRMKDWEVAKDAQELRRKPVSTLRRPVFEESRNLTAAERGTSLHMVMQYIDFQRTDTLEHVRQEIQRLVDGQFITPRQGEAADAQAIVTLFASPLGQRLLQSPRVEREYRFSLRTPVTDFFLTSPDPRDHIQLRGVIDCWYMLPDGTLAVVDFKTDHVTEEKLDILVQDYEAQVDAYSMALSRIMGIPVTRRSLWFFGIGREIVL